MADSKHTSLFIMLSLALVAIFAFAPEAQAGLGSFISNAANNISSSALGGSAIQAVQGSIGMSALGSSGLSIPTSFNGGGLLAAGAGAISSAVSSATGGILGLSLGFEVGDTIGRVLCEVVDWIDGPIGRGLATLSVVTIGVGFLTGKISPGIAAMAMVGIATIFAGPDILNDLLKGVEGGMFNTVKYTGDGCFESTGGLSLSIPLGSAIADVLCQVVGWMLGPIGRAISTLAIIVLGVGAMFGKVSWQMALTTCIGIGVMYGAPDIIYQLTNAAGAGFTFVLGCNNQLF